MSTHPITVKFVSKPTLMLTYDIYVCDGRIIKSRVPDLPTDWSAAEKVLRARGLAVNVADVPRRKGS